jgi:hypothetical protein
MSTSSGKGVVAVAGMMGALGRFILITAYYNTLRVLETYRAAQDDVLASLPRQEWL